MKLNIDSPTIYLASSSPGDFKGLHINSESNSVLISFAYFKNWFKHYKLNGAPKFRSVIIDSGAFTVFNSGGKIDLNEYIDFLLTIKSEFDYDQAFSLDVINDADATLKNCEEIWRQGAECIPVYHIGEPWEFLEHYTKTYPKTGIGGVASLRAKKEKKKFIEQVFSRTWPSRLHGLACTGDEVFLNFPWHSVDSASWSIQPQKFGMHKLFGQLPLRHSDFEDNKIPLDSQVEFYLIRERRAKQQWRKEMKQLEQIPEGLR